MLLMGILNLSPDSFSGDGATSLVGAISRAERLVNEGADILDIGGQSTRPWSEPISEDEEGKRVIPFLESLRGHFKVEISVDTTRGSIAKASLERGATIINDISAGSDPNLLKAVANHGATIVLMHMQKTPKDMQQDPSYPDGVVETVKEFLVARRDLCLNAGIPKEKIWIDPGIGFGKTVEHNLRLLHHLDQFKEIGSRILIGTSRKSFIAKSAGNSNLPMNERVPGTIATNLYAATKGASVFRVHDVLEVRRSLEIWQKLENAK